MSKEIDKNNNKVTLQSEESKITLNKKNKDITEKKEGTINNKDLNNMNLENDDINSNICLNTSNEMNNNEDCNINRTIISPELSPEEKKLSDDNIFDDNIIINSTQEEIFNYNFNPFISPTMKKKSYTTISKMDKIIIEYNLLKKNFNKILAYDKDQSNINNKDKYYKKISEYNVNMLNYLSSLSDLLNKLVESHNIYTNKKLLYSSTDEKNKKKLLVRNVSPTSGLDNTEKILNLYEKQYNRITERLKKIKNKEYINDLKTKINNLNEEISIYQQENRDLYKNQKIQENLMNSNNYSSKNSNTIENNLKKKIEICDKIQNEFLKTSKKIENGKNHINSNEKKIQTLNEKYNNLTQMAKDMYDIDYFESIEKIKKRSKEKKLKIERKTREYEVNMHSIQSNYNKLRIRFEQNKKELLLIENENNILMDKYKNKQFELELCSKKLKDYQNINFKSKENKDKNKETINHNNKYKLNDIKEIKPKKRNLNIKLDSFNNKINLINNTDRKDEQKQIKIANNIISNKEIMNNEIYDNSIKNRKKNKIGALFLSSGPSVISLTKEKSNFGELNDIQLLNTSNKENNENKNIDFNSSIPKNMLIEKENINKVNKEIKNKQENQINKDVVNINIISKSNNKDNKESENKISNSSLNIPNSEEKNKKNFSPLINKNENQFSPQTLSKEMILKGLDEQEKENRTLATYSRNIYNKASNGPFDRRNILKLNFSFVSNKKDNNKLNKSLNTLPNERKLLNDEIEEDIITDNSADNINIKEPKARKFVTEENAKDINIIINKNNNLDINNNSIEIDKKLIIENKKNNNNGDENKENKTEEDIIENINEKANKSLIENNKNKRENDLNTILYNVNEDTKNDKLSNNKKNNDNDNNKEEEQINKSFEEDHIFGKKNEKEEENEAVNYYAFDDGDNIIDIDYDKI